MALFGSSKSPKVGDVAPDFTVKDVDGKELKLSKLVEQGNVVLAFFPRAFTGGCTRELSAYRDRHEDIMKTGSTVIAISNDDVEKQRSFRDSLKASYSFVADENNVLINAFELKGTFFNDRATFVIGKGRKVLAVQTGFSALSPNGAVQACSVNPPESLELITK